MPYRIPSFSALRGFEAAARLGSFKKAADELALTPSAVSHQVRALEDQLGVRLLERTERGLVITEVGRIYRESLVQALEILHQATAQVRGHGNARLMLCALPGLSARWLLPRLAEFHRRHPELEVSVVTAREPDFAASGADMLIRYGFGNWPGLDCDYLLGETLLPVCSPDYLAEAPPLETPADLARHTLIHYQDIPDEWPRWLASAGVAGLRGRRVLELDSRNMVLQAAADGIGIAMGRRPLVDRDLARGVLLAPFDQPLQTPEGYFLLCRKGEAERGKIGVFRAWLLEVCARGQEDED